MKKRTWKPKPDQTHTRNRKQPRGASGKFTRIGEVKATDLMMFRERVAFGMDCLQRIQTSLVGNLIRRTWFIARFEEQGKGKLYYRKVVEVIWESSFGRIPKGMKLKRECKTPGCVNERHYGLIPEEKIEMVSDTQARGFYDRALSDGEARLPIQNDSRAKQLRMNMYTRRAGWKKTDIAYFASIEELGLFVEAGDLICRKHGLELNALFEAVGISNIKDVRKPLALIEAEVGERLKEVEEPEDVLGALGYTSAPPPRKEQTITPPSQEPSPSEPHLVTTPTYDSVYAKVVQGGKLTPDEEAILESGPPPERRE